VLSYPVFRILGFALAALALLLLLLELPRVSESGKILLGSARRGRLGGWFSRALLIGGILLNLSYATFRFGVGVRAGALWFCAEALYYLLLCAARIFVVEEDRQITNESNPVKGDLLAWHTYRRGGFFMLVLSLAASGIVILALREERTHSYPNAVVIGAILFTAWRVGLALYQILRHRHARPVLSLSKLLSLAAALLSFFALQCTVLVRYARDFAYRLALNAITGAVVCLSLFAIGCFMLRRARHALTKKGYDRNRSYPF
jgi:hypothetical protein